MKIILICASCFLLVGCDEVPTFKDILFYKVDPPYVKHVSLDEIGERDELEALPPTPGLSLQIPTPPVPTPAPTPNPASPLIVDLDGDGIETVGLLSNIHFDHAGDGFREQTGWASTDDGFLALDRNGDGIINSAAELFGSETLLKDGSKAANGFAALAELDSNADGVIDANDELFGDLRIFRDLDQDGETDQNELLTLEEAGIQSLSLNYYNQTYTDEFGNQHRQVGNYMNNLGQSMTMTMTMTDVWFTRNLTRTTTEQVDVSSDIEDLPDVEGFGQAYSLHQAMARDESGELQELVTQFVKAESRKERLDLLVQIIFEWTGQEGDYQQYYQSPIDARKIGALEVFYGFDIPRPRGSGQQYAQIYGQIFDNWSDKVFYQLMARSYLVPFFREISWEKNATTGVWEGDFSRAVEKLFNYTEIGLHPGPAQDILQDFVQAIHGVNPYNTINEDLLRDAVGQFIQTADLSWYSKETIGIVLAATLNASDGADIINGNANNNILFGLDGNDTINGQAGNDVLDGGAGDDVLTGGAGNDEYRFGVGYGCDRVRNTDTTAGRYDVVRLIDGLTAAGLPEPKNDACWSPGANNDLATLPVMAPSTIPLPRRDPLALDLNRNGSVETLARDPGVFFDLDNSGFAEQTSWVAPGDGLLVLDLNQNNRIDGGAELFGTETLLSSGDYAENGYQALAEFDENNDGQITSEDAIFGDLRVWQDTDSDGIADKGELRTLAQLNIASIDVHYVTNQFTDSNNVEHREQGVFKYGDGRSGQTNTLWFDSDRRITVPVEIHNGEGIDISDDIAGLPNAVGFGNAYSLHQAMALDDTGELQQLVEAFVAEADPAARKALVSDILILWTGQQNTDPASRGSSVDGRHVAILETFWGQPALQENPNGEYAQRLNDVYQRLERSIYTQLMKDSHVAGLYRLLMFTKKNGVWVGDFSLVSIYFGFEFLSGDATVAAELADFIDVVKGISPYTDTMYRDFVASLELIATDLPPSSRDNMLAVVRLGDDHIMGSELGESLKGYAGNDEIEGLSGDDDLYGGAGNDILNGGYGNDTLSGGDGNDLLHGGNGNDTLTGGNGSDSYIFGSSSGLDTVNNFDSDSSSIDIARFEDVSIEELWFSRTGNNLQITVVGSDDRVTISNWYRNANYQLDRIEVGSSVLLNNQVEQLVSAMASYSVPSGVGNVIPREVKEELQPVLAETWQTT